MSVETFKEEWCRWIKGSDYRILVIEGVDDLDPINNNVDLEVHFDDGRRYGATFFTPRNLQYIIEKDAGTEWDDGPYVWSPYMVVVRDLCPQTIAETVAHLIRSERLDQVFVRYADADGEKKQEQPT